MKREFQWARRIIVLFTALVFMILLLGSFGNGVLELIPLAGVFAGVAWVVCFLGTGISRKIIQIGDRISNKILRVLYYVFLVPLVVIIWLGIWWIIESNVGSNNGFNAGKRDLLEEALIALFWGAFFVVVLLTTYLQSLLVLLRRRILKNKGEEEEGQETI